MQRVGEVVGVCSMREGIICDNEAERRHNNAADLALEQPKQMLIHLCAEGPGAKGGEGGGSLCTGSCF